MITLNCISKNINSALDSETLIELALESLEFRLVFKMV